MSTVSIFIDTSVILSAAGSKRGHSSGVLFACKRKIIYGYISSYVTGELKRNAPIKLDEKGKQRLNTILQQGNLICVLDPSQEEVDIYTHIIKHKDAPILAAAVKNNVAILVTLDTTDFKKPIVQQAAYPLRIMTPREFVTTRLSLPI